MAKWTKPKLNKEQKAELKKLNQEIDAAEESNNPEVFWAALKQKQDFLNQIEDAPAAPAPEATKGKGEKCEQCGRPKKTWRCKISQWDGEYVCGSCERKARAALKQKPAPEVTRNRAKLMCFLISAPAQPQNTMRIFRHLRQISDEFYQYSFYTKERDGSVSIYVEFPHEDEMGDSTIQFEVKNLTELCKNLRSFYATL